jgi:ABC-type multidrug transport system fused ATPase/permease subunit
MERSGLRGGLLAAAACGRAAEGGGWGVGRAGKGGLPGDAAAAGAAGAAGAAAEGERLLDFEVEEGGKNLSLGQQQLVCLTRALLRASSPLVAFDEASSTVDASTAAQVNETLRHGFPGSTVIMVAHKLEGIMDFDVVLVLSGGRTAEVGPPQELLARGRALGSQASESGPGAFFLLVQESRKGV